MGHCAVATCKSNNNLKAFDKNIKFFRFPKCKSFQEKWIRACKRRTTFSIDSARICSLHFTENDWRLQDRLLKEKDRKKIRISKEAIPSKNLPPDNEGIEAEERYVITAPKPNEFKMEPSETGELISPLNRNKVLDIQIASLKRRIRALESQLKKSQEQNQELKHFKHYVVNFLPRVKLNE